MIPNDLNAYGGLAYGGEGDPTLSNWEMKGDSPLDLDVKGGLDEMDGLEDTIGNDSSVVSLFYPDKSSSPY